jgi:DoxX-like family
MSQSALRPVCDAGGHIVRSKRFGAAGKAGEFLVRFCVVVMIAGSIVKFAHPARPAAYMSYLGYHDDALYVVAALEALAGIAFVLPVTRRIGLLLVSSYFGGAIAAHLASHPFAGGGPFLAFNANHHYLGTVPALIVLSCAWTGAYLLGDSRSPDAAAARLPGR